MKKIDWYILKKFYKTFFFIILLMLLVVLVIDYSEKTDDFVKSKKSFLEVMNLYYLGFIPHIISLLFHLFVFIAVIFFTAKMANQTEVIPILAAGVPYNRFLRPYVVGGSLLAILLWWASSGFIPKSNKKQTDFKAQYVDPNLRIGTEPGNYLPRYLKIDSNTFAGIKNYDTGTKSASQFFTHTIKNNRLIKNTRSNTLKWDTSIKNTWRMENVVERIITKTGEKDTFSSFKNKKFNFVPDDIKYDEYVKDKLTSNELKRFISLQEKRGAAGVDALKVELYRRDATAVAVLVLTLMGALISSRKSRGGIGLQLALGVVLAMLYVMLDKFSSVFAGNGNMHPLLAAWLPNLLFLFVTIILYKRAQK
jgi:lipopolysaccharide export system permease protein